MQALYHTRQVSCRPLATRNYSSKVFWEENTTPNLQKNGPSVTSDFPEGKKVLLPPSVTQLSGILGGYYFMGKWAH